MHHFLHETLVPHACFRKKYINWKLKQRLPNTRNDLLSKPRYIAKNGNIMHNSPLGSGHT